MNHLPLTKLALLLVVLLQTSGCLPEPLPAIDEATVLADNTSVRLDASSSARTLFRLDQGERVSIIEKRATWYLVRDRDQLEGWMDESTILRDATAAAMRLALSQAASQPVQNTAEAQEIVNLRLDPGRDTDIIRQLRRGTSLEVLERQTTPRPDRNTTDIWFKVRPSPDEIGWVYSQLIEFDIPEAILPFTEGRTYTAVQQLNQIEDPQEGLVNWYVVGERRPETDPALDFDGLRVFIWNLEEQQYETTLRLRNLRGMYPLERTGNDDEPGFRFRVLDADGESRTREFVMRGTLPREVR